MIGWYYRADWLLSDPALFRRRVGWHRQKHTGVPPQITSRKNGADGGNCWWRGCIVPWRKQRSGASIVCATFGGVSLSWSETNNPTTNTSTAEELRTPCEHLSVPLPPCLAWPVQAYQQCRMPGTQSRIPETRESMCLSSGMNTTETMETSDHLAAVKHNYRKRRGALPFARGQRSTRASDANSQTKKTKPPR